MPHEVAADYLPEFGTLMVRDVLIDGMVDPVAIKPR